MPVGQQFGRMQFSPRFGDAPLTPGQRACDQLYRFQTVHGNVACDMMIPERNPKMSTTLNEFTGRVHGKTIELEQEPGLPDGQPVKVTVQPVPQAPAGDDRLPPGEGLRRAFGAWADDAEELDKFLEEVRRSRKRTRREIEP